MRSSLEITRSNQELETKKAQESVEKSNLEAKVKLQEQQKKMKMEAADKEKAEQAQKKKIEEAEKKKQEEEEKQRKIRQEQQQKAAEQDQKEREKQRKNSAEGRWCSCQATSVNFNGNDQWHLCPSGYLFTGFYRGNEQWLTSIQYYHCCRACREDGSTTLGVGSCTSGQWQRSFDYEGWSNCPDNTFITGYYKSSCNYIYCIELAQCCKLESSQGRKSCGAKTSWASSLDSAGWSITDGNQFVIGLYRSGGPWLYNIEYAHQCTFYSYAKQ